jgi:signal transduction histidine kinase
MSVPFNLIREAGECHSTADFSRVLAALAKFGGADACVLWETISFGTVDRRFFALAEHFPGGLGLHFLPLESLTGEVVLLKERRAVNNLREAVEQGRTTSGRHFLDRGVQSFCSVPISLGEKRDAAVNLYRFNDTPFSNEDVDRIAQAAAAIPHLFTMVRNEMGFRLLRDVEKALRDRGVEALDEILRKVTDAFNVLESAIYLEDPLEAPETYKLRASVWPWDWEPAKQYKKSDEALTTWAIRSGKPLRFFDLSHFEEEVLVWGYDGVTCRNRERLQRSAQNYFQSDTLPPLSFICVPVKDLNRTIGAIRCCVTRTGPHLFDDRHIEILEFVGDQIGERWGTMLNLKKESGEKRRFEMLTKGVDQLNILSFLELRKLDGPSERRQLESGLDLLAQISDCDEALSIRMIQDEKLHIVAHKGKRWKEGGQRRLEERTSQEFPRSDEFGGWRAIADRRVIVDERAGQPGRLRSTLFPDASRLLFAPIIVSGTPIGVVDIRGFGDRPFPMFLDLITSLIARQFGLYQHMFQQFRRLQQTTTKLQKSYDEQNQIYDDFHHQISSPIQRAHFFAEQAVRAQRPSVALLRAIRGNARVAEQVAQNIRYFIALAKDEFVKPEVQVLVADRLWARLVEMAEDEEAVAMQSKQLSFEVDGKSFEVLKTLTVWANFELLEHAVMNLLDNAVKYSFRQTNVVIRAGYEEVERRFRVGVINKGFPIPAHERKNLVVRGYRGDRARLNVVEGRGIGLYIVQQFMQSMGGWIEIIPTDSRGLNEFRLLLPVRDAQGRIQK